MYVCEREIDEFRVVHMNIARYLKEYRNMGNLSLATSLKKRSSPSLVSTNCQELLR